jgi:hypothetical protein
MVGGLSESEYVQKSMQTAFPDINVLIPEDPELAVMKGAVLFGFNPSVITARVAMLKLITRNTNLSPICSRVYILRNFSAVIHRTKNFHKRNWNPKDPELAVMKGAVLFGFNPSVITARVAMLTYGTNSYIPFKNGIHPENKKVVMDVIL